MHGTIYQIAKDPIDPKDYIGESDLPDWFVESKVDYVDRMNEEYTLERAKRTGSRPGLSFDPETRKLTVTDVHAYFQEKYDEFIKIAEEIAQWTMDDFIDRSGFKMFLLNNVYNEEAGIYVYSEDEGIQTLDEWMRCDGTYAYIGTAFDYHI